MSTDDVEKVLLKFGLLDEDGREHPDPVPVAPPIGHNPQPSLAEKIRAMVQSEHLRLAAEQAGMETFDEADDFEVDEDDDFDPSSPWENEFDQPVSELRKREAEEKAALADAKPERSDKAPEAPQGIPDDLLENDDGLPPGAAPAA